jgi:hypothetical protein
MCSARFRMRYAIWRVRRVLPHQLRARVSIGVAHSSAVSRRRPPRRRRWPRLALVVVVVVVVAAAAAVVSRSVAQMHRNGSGCRSNANAFTIEHEEVDTENARENIHNIE